MEEYLVSARKYRPATFASVIGQKTLVTTLRNAITDKQLAHAYLFCGTRGVGKTTTARIFAKAINCEHLQEGEPCNQCDSCKAFNEGRSMNIHELDAASNNSVEDIRNLIEQVQIPPQTGRYSVYIIDEVHMLSASAFNAFLKTLEEPPSYAVFILATTEKHKILETILSRCQVYDFARITVSDTIAHLQDIASKEGVEIDTDGLSVIATKSDGGMRDALSTFDQLVSCCGKKIRYQDVIDNLGVLDYDYFFRFTDHFLKGEVNASLLLLDEILHKGFNAANFTGGLAAHLRDVMVSKDATTLPLLQVGDGIKQRYQEQAARCSNPFLYDALDIVCQCEAEYRGSQNKRLLVELMLIRLCQLSEQKKND
ncbi:MAG: DNA polymerase III subunit gamma/tau [Paludibacteraceae bacterium]|nr:DNA polymerase III subunit gamma/tau [Paludibacteraceae bacterium]